MEPFKNNTSFWGISNTDIFLRLIIANCAKVTDLLKY